MKNIIFLSPYIAEKVWGGQHLKDYNIDVPNKPIGEAWMISGIADHSSKVVNNGHVSLRDFFRDHKHFFDNFPGDEYPLLVKILDCNDNLSVQVHPTSEYHEKHPMAITKNEMWYILDAKPNANIIYGHTAKTKEELIGMVENRQWDSLLIRTPVKKGDLFYVPAGTVHALGVGLVIFEIQQASDTTYRIYDYGRDQKNRPLTIKESIENITVPFTVPKNLVSHGNTVITPYFSFNKITHSGSRKYDFPTARWLQCTVINGSGTIDTFTKIKKGDTFIVGNNTNCISLVGELEMIITYISKS